MNPEVTKPPRGRPKIIQGCILGILLLIVMAFVGGTLFAITRELVLFQAPPLPTSIPDLVLQPPTATIEGVPSLTVELGQPTFLPTPLSTEFPEATLTSWDGKERVTILVMGVDYRDWIAGEGAARSDTMMLMTLDPVTKTAGMLSVPRDLWVGIPGYIHAKINTAHAIGGPSLAVRTVELVIGVPIHYYAVVDFGAFVRFIDELGGVKLDIPDQIEVDPIGDENKIIRPGVQTLPGDLALAYARNRSTGDGDFGRARRQQQVILGIRDRIIDFEMLPTLIEKAPALYRELVGGVNTNMQLDELIKLAVLAAQVPDGSIVNDVIDIRHVAFGWSPDELSVLVPYPDKIRVLRDEIFATSGVLGPLTPGNDQERMSLEGASISVQNGSSDPNIARRTGNYLTSQGARIIEVRNANESHTYTTVIDHSGRPYTVQYVVSLLGIEGRYISYKYDPAHPFDVEIIIGNDWTSKFNLP
ncbi:MAG: LCP family protein [Anaerolineales bacterium]|nr:LCP family protein [Chloroflexota bacterium]MBL6979827.1 LCP family protein [Anaerolineales bacterium]